MARLRLREVKWFVQGHTKRKGQIKDSSVGLSGPKVRSLNFYLPVSPRVRAYSDLENSVENTLPSSFYRWRNWSKERGWGVTCPWSQSKFVRVRTGSQPCTYHPKTLLLSASPLGVQDWDPYGKQGPSVREHSWEFWTRWQSRMRILSVRKEIQW